MFLFAAITLQAQDEEVRNEIEAEKRDTTSTLNFGADLVSRYVWRGIDFGNSPAIQPNFSFAWKGLSIGAWGTYGFSRYNIEINDTTMADAGNYAETDLYLSYTYKWFTLMVFDFFTVNGLNPNEGNHYFDYKNATTRHAFEGSIAFHGSEKFPLQFLVSTLFYGADKDQDSTGQYGLGDKNNYSTYFELGYKIHLRKMDVDLSPFIGGIPFGSSWYGPYAGITNIGMTARKSIPVTTQYAIPVQVSIITNPQAQNMFFVFGISF